MERLRQLIHEIHGLSLCQVLWISAVITVPIDGQERIGAFVYAEDGRSFTTVANDEFVPLQNRRGQHASLTWRCDVSGEVGLVVAPEGFFSTTDTVGVHVRVDEEPTVRGRRWAVSADGSAVIAPGQDVGAFSEVARRGSSVWLRINDYLSRPFVPYDLGFELAGLSDALNRLECNR